METVRNIISYIGAFLLVFAPVSVFTEAVFDRLYPKAFRNPFVLYLPAAVISAFLVMMYFVPPCY
ncbi:MAG: hypothetical protein LBK58_15170 [Prevotellaceae bacterium]|nr:hypothetical protein [Prevotellaceae bacterium]